MVPIDFEANSVDSGDLDAPICKSRSANLRGLETEGSRLTKNVERWIDDVASSTDSLENDVADLPIYGDDEPPRKRSKAVITEPEKVQWSDDEDEVDPAYKKFKARHSVARKRATKSTRKAKAIEAENNPLSKRNEIGRRTVHTRRTNGKEKAKTRDYGDVSSSEDLMEWTLPEYLQKRRVGFDKRVNTLKQGGLKLPPSYDDIDFSDDERLQHLRERPDFPTIKPCRPYEDIQLPYSLGLVPAPIAQWLRDYQVKGTSFLHELFVYQKGGILGDDMGLGKTVQVIAFLTAAYGKTGDERDEKRLRKMRNAQGGGSDSDHFYPRTLILCPGSLMANWMDELERWGWWHADVYHGAAVNKDAVLSSARSGRLEVMITTYTTYRMNASAINMVAWDCVVADECHQFKGRRTELTVAMNELNALCRIGLTGTAIQNNYEELWTLLNWTNPGKLGPITTWKESICVPLKLGQSHNATVYQLSRARKTAKALVQNLLPQFFLRRMKTLIKDQLPKKSDRVVFCPLTKTQARAYEAYLDSEIVQKIKYSGDLCHCGSLKKVGWCCHMNLSDGSKWQSWVFPAIMTLQKLSNHLAILIPQSVDPKEKQDKDLATLEIVLPDQWQNLYATRDNMMNFANPEFCGKWRVLKKLLSFWNNEGGNKVLVFSHSVRLLKMLQTLFINTSYNVKYLDGSMSYDDRFAAVSDFNTDPTQFVFLISTRAGGVGLNITSANKVVVVDPNWNPSYDLQAQDRAYRIGQTRDVEVFRLVSQGTLEEIVYARQIYKQQQASIGYNASNERRYFQGVQDTKDQKGEIFGLKNLFSYAGDGVVLREIVNKTNIAESRADVQVIGMEIKDEDDKDEDAEAKPENEDELEARIKNEPENEEAAMSQLAAMIIGDDHKKRSKKAKNETMNKPNDNAKKHDPVQAILSSVGVQYTHENSEVIGSSKVESRLSKRAEEAAEGEKWPTQEQQAKVFFEESQSQRKFNEMNDFNPNSRIRYKYRPPEDVKRRQFCSMAKWAGYEDVVEFALVVEGWTQEERRDILTRFYQWRKEAMEKDDERLDAVTRGAENVDQSMNAVKEEENVAKIKSEVRPESEEMKVEDYNDDDEL